MVVASWLELEDGVSGWELVGLIVVVEIWLLEGDTEVVVVGDRVAVAVELDVAVCDDDDVVDGVLDIVAD